MTSRITLEDSPEQHQLIKAMLSKDISVAGQAREAFAAVMGAIVQEVIQQASLAAMIYQDLPYDADTNPSLQLDLFYDQAAQYVTIWQQNMAGGLPVSVVDGVAEMKFSTYRLDTAIEINNKYIKRSDLTIVAKSIQRMAQEIVVKQNRNAFIVLFRALAEALTKGTKHTITSTNQNVFDVHDVNRLFTLAKRLNTSFANGTPDPTSTKGLTDLLLSYEMMQEVRSWPYNPVNNRGSTSTGPVTLPNSVRESIFQAAGAASIWGVALHELAELGTGKSWNDLFNLYATASISFSSGNFSPSGDELIVGLDLSREAFWRPVEKNADHGGTFTTEVSDEYVRRQQKIGFYGGLEEGRVVTDARALTALIV